jgi:two-component system sensor histidine kinase CpxA
VRLFAKLTAWFFVTLALSVIAFGVTIRLSRPPVFDGRAPRQATNQFKLETAVRAWQEEGATGLRATLERMDEGFLKGHVLLDADGRDVLTGEDRSALRARAQRRFNEVGTRNGGYTLVFAMPPPPPPPLWLWPYLVLIALLIAVMCWVFTRHLVNPVRHLRATVREFGAGNLTLRTDSKRHDELGDLGRDFDLMADRIETLLTSERRLLQDVSHELRTPLARLVLAVELMRPQEAKQEVARLSSLIGELVDMTRAEGGMVKVDSETVDVSALLEETAAPYNIVLAVDQHLVCHGHTALLRRALDNVLQNAVRYSPEGNPPTLSATCKDGCVVICVRDFGPGVPEEALVDMFRPFYRAVPNDADGVGLGLAIAQRAVRLHRGDIRARNVHPGLEVAITVPQFSRLFPVAEVVKTIRASDLFPTPRSPKSTA